MKTLRTVALIIFRVIFKSSFCLNCLFHLFIHSVIPCVYTVRLCQTQNVAWHGRLKYSLVSVSNPTGTDMIKHKYSAVGAKGEEGTLAWGISEGFREDLMEHPVIFLHGTYSQLWLWSNLKDYWVSIHFPIRRWVLWEQRPGLSCSPLYAQHRA